MLQWKCNMKQSYFHEYSEAHRCLQQHMDPLCIREQDLWVPVPGPFSVHFLNIPWLALLVLAGQHEDWEQCSTANLGCLILAFLALYRVLFFIINLINLHSPQGAAANSSPPIRQTHLCYFDFGCGISLQWFVYLCIIQKNTGAGWTGKYSQLELP